MVPRWLLAAGLAALVGCSTAQIRSQSEDDSDPEPRVKTIGDVTSVVGADSIPVIGLGLVTGLDGTGGGVPPGSERSQLEAELQKRGVENIAELFASKTTSLVRVSAAIPAGARKGDAIDLIITVPESSRTTSLRGGTLEWCYLYNFNSTQNLTGDPSRPDRLLRGHPMVKGEGPILAGLPEPGEDEPSLTVGRVWGGGKVLLHDRPFILTLNEPSFRASAQIAQRINETFHGPEVSGTTALATAKNKTHVSLSIPGQYRLNLGRFLRVIRFIPLSESPAVESDYFQTLVRDLQDPDSCVTAALKIEALGARGIPALKLALHGIDPQVRFAAAEALAYLGCPVCGDELAKQAMQRPYTRAYALTALASLNESVCRMRLQELLAQPQPDLRFGAFRALRSMDDREPTVAGEKLGEAFWLHRLAPRGPSQIHLTLAKRPEVILFGAEPKFVPPVSVLAGEFTLTAAEGADRCTLTRFSVRHGRHARTTATDAEEVLRALVELGGTYTDAVTLLKQADATKALNCAVLFETLPKAPTVQEMAKN